MHDLVIRNGRVVDDTGQQAFYADVAVRDGKITEIGPKLGLARREVDADGLLLKDFVAPVRDDAIDGRVLRHGHVTAVAVADEAGEDEHGEAGQDQAGEDELLTTGHRMIVPDFDGLLGAGRFTAPPSPCWEGGRPCVAMSR